MALQPRCNIDNSGNPVKAVARACAPLSPMRLLKRLSLRNLGVPASPAASAHAPASLIWFSERRRHSRTGAHPAPRKRRAKDFAVDATKEPSFLRAGARGVSEPLLKCRRQERRPAPQSALLAHIRPTLYRVISTPSCQIDRLGWAFGKRADALLKDDERRLRQCRASLGEGAFAHLPIALLIRDIIIVARKPRPPCRWQHKDMRRRV
eukprot:scaffold101414_cov28-Tisochrysis_lutea.AAC.2